MFLRNVGRLWTTRRYIPEERILCIDIRSYLKNYLLVRDAVLLGGEVCRHKGGQQVPPTY
jgi:hypothetical protein